MTFSDYKVLYNNFLRSLNQTQIISIVADDMFDEFPQRLPEKFKQLLLQRFEEFQSISSQIASERTDSQSSVPKVMTGNNDFSEGFDSDNIGRIEVEINSNRVAEGEFILSFPRGDRLFKYVFQMAFSCDRDQVAKDDADPFRDASYSMLPRYQALAMSLAHLNAFLGDTVQIICVSHPEILQRSGEREVSWKTVLNFSDKQDAIRHFATETTYKFGQKSIKERLKILRNDYELKININSREERELELFEKKRHLVIHNGGLIDSKYIKMTGNSLTDMGKPLTLSTEDIDRCSDIVGMVGSSVFKSVSLRYFGATDADFSKLLMLS